MLFTRLALIPPRIWAIANTVQLEVTTPGVPLAGVQAVEPEAVEAGLTLETIKEIIMVLVRKFSVQPNERRLKEVVLNFKYSEKATKMFHLVLTLLSNFKKIWDFFSSFVAFSRCLNFNNYNIAYIIE
jgi:hypothetical protein